MINFDAAVTVSVHCPEHLSHWPPGHGTFLMVKPCDPLIGNSKPINSPPAPFSPALHCRCGRSHHCH